MLIPLTTIEGNLTIYEGTYGTFETWDYWDVSVCADPPTEVLFNISVRPATDNEERRLPYTQYLYFSYNCERYKFAVAKVIYNPDSGFSGVVVVSKQLKQAQAKLLKTLILSGCKLELTPILTTGLLQNAIAPTWQAVGGAQTTYPPYKVILSTQ